MMSNYAICFLLKSMKLSCAGYKTKGDQIKSNHRDKAGCIVYD